MYFGQYYMCTILSYFILLALRKKQTNEQTEECWEEHCNSCSKLQWARILIKKISKKEISKNTAIQEKLPLHTTSY